MSSFSDTVGEALALTVADLEQPTDGLGRPRARLAESERVAARAALRIFTRHLADTRFGISHVELLAISRRAGL